MVGVDPGLAEVGLTMASVFATECKPIMGALKWSPQQGPGAESMVQGQGAQLPVAERFLSIFIQKMGRS